MPPTDWDRLHHLFDAAVDLTPEDRAALLAAACPHEPAVRAEVEALLASYDAEPDFLEAPAARVTLGDGGPGGPDGHALARGDRVGPYRVVREVGVGGMGRVYLAERADGAFRQAVALKVARRRGDVERRLRRFEGEREILARLDHPHIARLVDGGATADGRLYFAMEYVEGGLPITEYCGAHGLGLDARLALFADVCAAVQHAHQALVIHRDLTPANVLVSARGAVKLLDFGVAKRLGGGGGLTTGGPAPMTLAYASPEQVAGRPVTTATDVYALGVLLYELVAGRRPFEGADPAALVRTVAEGAPPPPSAALRARGDAALARRVEGDLDLIVGRASHRDPARRYASAAALADDLARWRGRLPVAARPDSVGYRARTFVRRHRWAVAGAAGLAVVVLAFGVAMAALAARLGEEAARAARERDAAEEVTGLLVRLFEAGDVRDTPGGDTLRVADLLAQGEAQILPGLRDQPVVHARLAHALGRVHAARSRYDRARPLFRDALETLGPLGGPDAAAVLADLGRLERDLGDNGAAERRLRAAAALYGGAGGRPGDRARALADLGGVVADTAEAFRHFRRALAVAGPSAGARAYVLRALGDRRMFVGDRGGALAAWRAARAALGETPPGHALVHGLRAREAGALLQLDRHAEAAGRFRALVADARAVYGDSTVPVARAYDQLGIALALGGDHGSAERAFRAALARWRAAGAGRHHDAASALRNVGRALQLQGRPREALPLLEEARALMAGVDTSRVFAAGIDDQIGLVLVEVGRTAEGVRRLRRAVAVERAAVAAGQWSPVRLADAELRLATALLAAGRPAEAHDLALGALEAFEADLAEGHPRVAQARVALGAALAGLGRPDEAGAHLAASLGPYARWGLADPVLLDHARRARARL
ncbi:serine/threonine-protein kinase [Rubrivirga marina]|uniref:Protein kinase domain-containing protein n=1 Tax=Rubrivirga marina TaxID=1196024 RepID=A0A271J173_9BACT|nr:serine/threonine-protein kinase [Rubrivirga marina]PAP77242.1 hypothetical protein BSZ37_12765 [Rubrivirga marina]